MMKPEKKIEKSRELNYENQRNEQEKPEKKTMKTRDEHNKNHRRK